MRLLTDSPETTLANRLSHRVRLIITDGLGLASFLWIAVAYLVHTSLVPRPGLALVATFAVIGLVLQIGAYLLSIRRWFLAQYVMVRVAAIFCLIPAGALILLVLTASLIYKSIVGAPIRWDWPGMALAAAVSMGLFASGLWAQVGLFQVYWQRRRQLEAARPAARLLLPVGPFSLHRLIRRVQQILGEHGQNSGRTERGLANLIHQMQVVCDSRFDRPVPWQVAWGLIGRYADMVNQTEGLPARIRMQGQEPDERVRLRPSVVCAVLKAVGHRAEPGSDMVMRSFRRASSLVIRCEVSLATDVHPDNWIEPESGALAARGLRRALGEGLVLSRMTASPAAACCELICEPMAMDHDRTWDHFERVERELEVFSHCESSRGAKRCFQLGDLAIKAQRLDLPDPKPTLIEEEYLIMRRLRDTSSAFPSVVGFGVSAGYQWIAYRFEAGQRLKDWFVKRENRRQWFRVLVNVGNMIRCMRENAVAHRDLNAGNIIVRPDGELVLLDFDQAVADDEAFADADAHGAERDLAHNDLKVLVEECGLTRSANHAIQSLERAWALMAAQAGQTLPPYEFEFAGSRFDGTVSWCEQWMPLASSMGPVQGRRILDLAAGEGLFDAYLASCGAEVTAVIDEDRIEVASVLADAADVDVSFVTCGPGKEWDRKIRQDYDLVLLVGRDTDHIDLTWLSMFLQNQKAVVFEVTESLEQARQFVEDGGMTWQGIIGYTGRLCPLVSAVREV